MFSAADRAQAIKDQQDLDEMNRLLTQVGQIADRLTNGGSGYEVVMTLWHDTQGSHTVTGRLQGNVAKVRLREPTAR